MVALLTGESRSHLDVGLVVKGVGVAQPVVVVVEHALDVAQAVIAAALLEMLGLVAAIELQLELLQVTGFEIVHGLELFEQLVFDGGFLRPAMLGQTLLGAPDDARQSGRNRICRAAPVAVGYLAGAQIQPVDESGQIQFFRDVAVFEDKSQPGLNERVAAAVGVAPDQQEGRLIGLKTPRNAE